jgi:hypothetical protein
LILGPTAVAKATPVPQLWLFTGYSYGPHRCPSRAAAKAIMAPQGFLLGRSAEILIFQSFLKSLFLLDYFLGLGA